VSIIRRPPTRKLHLRLEQEASIPDTFEPHNRNSWVVAENIRGDGATPQPSHTICTSALHLHGGEIILKYKNIDDIKRTKRLGAAWYRLVSYEKTLTRLPFKRSGHTFSRQVHVSAGLNNHCTWYQQTYGYVSSFSFLPSRTRKSSHTMRVLHGKSWITIKPVSLSDTVKILYRLHRLPLHACFMHHSKYFPAPERALKHQNMMRLGGLHVWS
jgi:hypothetical protein